MGTSLIILSGTPSIHPILRIALSKFPLLA